jgi:uncharacterized protein YjiS (DUF1127 family)
METKTGAIPIRMVIAMIALTKPVTAAFRLPHWRLPRLTSTERRRKQAMIDLIHASPHLLQDIGVTDGMIAARKK